MKLPRVKVCGLTRSSDLEFALAAGADAVGFVHYPPSPRHVDVEKCARLVRSAEGQALRVLVTVDLTPEALAALVSEIRPDAVQLCGEERPVDCAQLELPVLRRLPVEAEAVEQVSAWRGRAIGFVLDHPASPGGSGRQVDLQLAARLAKSAPCLLAGGLGPDSVAQAIRTVGPQGVDASSQLESSAGQKDPARVQAFIENARREFQQPLQ